MESVNNIENVYRTWFEFDLSPIPINATLSGVTVSYSNGGGSYNLKLTQPASVNPSDLGGTWTAIGNSSSLHTRVPYDGSDFTSVPIMNAIQNTLSNRKMFIGALSENESTEGSQSSMTISLYVTYTYPAAILTLQIQNDLDGNGNGGSIGVSISPAPATPRTSPYLFTAYENNKLNLEAYDNQTVNGKNYIFNNNEGLCNFSYWEKSAGGKTSSLGPNQSFTTEALKTGDDYATITAKLKVFKVTTNGTLTENEKWYSNVSLTGDVIIPSNKELRITSCAAINLNGHTILSTGGTIVNEGANIIGLAAYIKTSSNAIVGYCGSIQSACNAAASGQKVEITSGSHNGSFSLNSKSEVTISGYGATINGTINLTNATYCRLYGVYLPSGHVYINGGIGNIIMDVRSDREYEVLFIENTANNAVYGLTATNGDMNNFGLYIYNSTGDICRSSIIENHACGIYLSGTSSYNVTEDYFCNNGFDVDAEGGAYAYLLHNTYSRIKPISVYGNCIIPDPPSALACSSASGLAKSNTASLSLNNQAEVKGTPAGELDRMYLDLIHRTSQDTTLDHKGRIEKYKSEYLSIAEKSKGELKKSFNDLSKLKNSLSLTANCLRYLGEEGSLSSYLSELLGMSDLQPYSPYIKKYLIPGLIGKNDYTGALAQCDEVLKAKDIDRDLTCEMLYEKGIINRFYLSNNTEAYRAFSSITAKYPDHPLGKMAMGQISEMPGVEVEKPGLKSLGNTSEGFTCSNYPNPFNPSTRFNFSIPSDGFTELKIYNSLGQEVKTLVSDYLAKGKYTFEWNATSYSSGIYYYFLKSGNNVTTSKIILLK
ncbi:MAG TPA: T9SS type A sorting domain-containing protein [Ignavibacteriales bacterium]|nr:T9SS type A sorting domain-containing protein [Ignavibacteriales bacterium]